MSEAHQPWREWLKARACHPTTVRLLSGKA
jgi:hypothetical protein